MLKVLKGNTVLSVAKNDRIRQLLKAAGAE